jgi:Na+-translocating ferredoxin:NAD+ oxidoreductase RNF subunit RnfB
MQGVMPRLARLDAPGILHHVIIRGIERKKIFRDTIDKQNLVDRLDQLIPQTQTSCYACGNAHKYINKFAVRIYETRLCRFFLGRVATGGIRDILGKKRAHKNIKNYLPNNK